VNGRRPPAPSGYRGTKMRENNNVLLGTVNKVDDSCPNRVMNDSDYVCLMSKINDSGLKSLDSSSWIIDSGCSKHLTFDRSLFVSYTEVNEGVVEMGTKAKAEIKGCGDVILNVNTGAGVVPCKFENVLHVPSFEYSLLSVSTMTKNGMKVTFESDKCEISKKSKILANAILQHSLYFLRGEPCGPSNESAHIASLQRWHERLAHVNHQGVSNMVSKSIVHGIKVAPGSSKDICEGCISGKAHRSVIPKVRTSERASGLLDLVH